MINGIWSNFACLCIVDKMLYPCTKKSIAWAVEYQQAYKKWKEYEEKWKNGKMEIWKYENIPAFRYHPLGSANFLFIFYAAPSPYHRLRFPFNAFLIYDFLVFFSLSRKRMHSFLPYIQSNLSKGDIGTMCLRKHFSNRISSNKWTCEMEKSCTNTHTRRTNDYEASVWVLSMMLDVENCAASLYYIMFRLTSTNTLYISAHNRNESERGKVNRNLDL